MKHIRKYEHGVAHVLALVGFVLLVAAVGFVGYNAWQKSMANAGGTWTVGNPHDYDTAKPATYRYGANNLCRMYHNLYGKVAVAKDQKTVIEIVSNGSTILSYDTAKQKPGTRYFTSKSYVGNLENAAVKYVVKTPTTKTVTQKGKNGKKKQVQKTVWSESASAVLVSDLPRCVPTSDPSEFNFYGGGGDGHTNVCWYNGELVYRWIFKKKNPSTSKSAIVAEVDGKTVKTTKTAGEKLNQYYYGRISWKGKQFKLYWTSDVTKKNSKPSVLVNRTIGSIKSCL